MDTQTLWDELYECSARQGERRAKSFSEIMDKARKGGYEAEALQMARQIEDECSIEFWELPKQLDKAKHLSLLPIDKCLPEPLASYLKAMCKSVQVYHEMAILPLLSVLSCCVQGKAVIKHPAADHTEPLNLYTLTVAAPGERKTSCMKLLSQPVYDYQKNWNDTHSKSINEYQTKKAYLENRKAEAMRGKNADLNKAQSIAQELAMLKPVYNQKLIVKDITPEALVCELSRQDERLAILDGEGSVFDVLSGLYSSGPANINIFLQGYDGSPYSVCRVGKDDNMLEHPLLTLGLMVQPSHLETVLTNKQFTGRGFIHRFLFSLPLKRSGELMFESPKMPDGLIKQYHDLITALLKLLYPNDIAKEPVLTHSEGSKLVLRDYFDHLQQTGAFSDDLTEWRSKQFGRTLRITGLLHFAKYVDKALNTNVDGDTARMAVEIARWSEEHAFEVLCSDSATEDESVVRAKLVIDKLIKLGKVTVPKGELKDCFRKLDKVAFESTLRLLEEHNFIRQISTPAQQKGRKGILIKLNPILHCSKNSD